MFVTGGEDRIALDAELQKEISIIWPYLPQKTLDLLVPINKGLALTMEAILSVMPRGGQHQLMSCVSPHRYGHDGGEDLCLHDDNGLLQTEQSQEAQATAGSSGQLCKPFLHLNVSLTLFHNYIFKEKEIHKYIFKSEEKKNTTAQFP